MAQEEVIRVVPEVIKAVADIKVGEGIQGVVVTKQSSFNPEEGVDTVVVVVVQV